MLDIDRREANRHREGLWRPRHFWPATPARRRESSAAARRHTNPLRIHRATLDIATRYAEIVVVTPSGPGTPLQREQLSHGDRQLIVVGASPDEIGGSATTRSRVATLGL